MRNTKALSGAAQDAYFRRVLKAQGSLSAEAREQVVRSLKRDIAQLRLRREPLAEGALPPAPIAEAQQPAAALPGARPDAAAAATSFDPFSPNVVVLLRTAGRAAVLAALAAIDNPEQLQLLAREQRLSVAPNLVLAELRAAILSAAERRIANRMAAAS